MTSPAAESATQTISAPSVSFVAQPRALLVGVCLFAISALLCAGAYLAASVPGQWFGGQPALRWGATELAVTQGSGRLTEDGLRIGTAEAPSISIISVETSFRSAGYAAVAWDTADVPDDVVAALVWRNDYEPGRRFTRSLSVEARRLLPITLADDPNWIGRINGLALIIRGDLSKPMLIRGVQAKPMTAAEILRDRLREWLTFEPWNGGSINNRNGGADAQDLPLPFVLAAVVGFGLIIYVALARWWPRSVGSFGLWIVGGLFVTAWFILDVPWQWNLMRQAHATFQQYGGKSWRDRHLGAEDGALFGFIEAVRAKLPPPPARVFMAADAVYFRDRGAYHLYPYNVYFNPYQNKMPDASQMRTGDYLVVFRRRGVQYDPALKKLRWDGGGAIDAELLLADSGGALFEVR